jgi:hypothetical protein
VTEHIDIPLESVDYLIGSMLAGKHSEVLGGLTAIRKLLRDPNIRSEFEINSTVLIHHQMNRITELENGAAAFLRDVNVGKPSSHDGFCEAFQEWLDTTKKDYDERVKDLLVQK